MPIGFDVRQILVVEQLGPPKQIKFGLPGLRRQFDRQRRHALSLRIHLRCVNVLTGT